MQLVQEFGAGVCVCGGGDTSEAGLGVLLF